MIMNGMRLMEEIVESADTLSVTNVAFLILSFQNLILFGYFLVRYSMDLHSV